MPIYEYRCSNCGFQKEFLQKVSDAPMRTCPDCGKETLGKMVTAAGFQLKGSGWYATDFKGAVKKAAGTEAAKSESTGESKSESSGESKGEAKTESKSESKSEASPDAKPGPAPATPSAT